MPPSSPNRFSINGGSAPAAEPFLDRNSVDDEDDGGAGNYSAQDNPSGVDDEYGDDDDGGATDTDLQRPSPGDDHSELGGTVSEPEGEVRHSHGRSSARLRAGYASDGMTSRQALDFAEHEWDEARSEAPTSSLIGGSRAARVSQLSRAQLAFGGPATRRAGSAPRGAAPSIRRGTAARAPRDRSDVHRRRTIEEDDESLGDPLVWTGGSPPPVATQPSPDIGLNGTAFALPPLASMTRTSLNVTSGNGSDRTKVLRCTSYCCALALDLIQLDRLFTDSLGRSCRMHKDGLNAVLHCTEANGRDGDAHSFFFSYGCVVTWGLSEAQERERVMLLAASGCAQEPISEHEIDDFGYTHVPGCKPGVAKDVISLDSIDVREKLAVSFALAQSVKLGVFERTVEQTIQETKTIPERMAIDGKIRLTQKDITKRIGQLFVDRASINLHSDILDHPDFFWEDDEWLPLYLRAAKYLEIDRRAEVLNKRLDIIKELFDMLASELNNAHANKLEWIIIVLIVLEVLFQIVEMVRSPSHAAVPSTHLVSTSPLTVLLTLRGHHSPFSRSMASSHLLTLHLDPFRPGPDVGA